MTGNKWLLGASYFDRHVLLPLPFRVHFPIKGGTPCDRHVPFFFLFFLFIVLDSLCALLSHSREIPRGTALPGHCRDGAQEALPPKDLPALAELVTQVGATPVACLPLICS